MSMKLFLIGLCIGLIIEAWLMRSATSTIDFMGDSPRARTGKDVALGLVFANPLNDVEAAIKAHDNRYVGIGGPGIVAPGVEGDVSIKDVKVIVEYSDYITSFAQKQVNDLVMNYAREYNKLLLERVSKTAGARSVHPKSPP